MSWYPLVVAKVQQEGPRDRTFTLSPRSEDLDAFAFEPGQHLVLREPGAEPQAQSLYYALSGRAADSGCLCVTVRRAGPGSLRMYSLKPGAQLLSLPPQGHTRISPDPGHTLVLLAAGSGVAPYRAYLERRADEASAALVWLFQSATSPQDLLFLEHFLRLEAQAAWFHFVPTVTQDPPASWQGRVGRLDAPSLAAALTHAARVHVHACGPIGFVQSMHALAQAAGVPTNCCHPS